MFFMIKVVELFAGVGGFRLGLEGTKKDRGFKVVWGNQWEPSTKVQHAFSVYASQFKDGIHSNQDIANVDTKDIPKHDLLVGGFPCQDYSVARSLSGEKGLQGKKGVLFWEIMRIVNDPKHRPSFVLLENVDRLLKSPSKQRGRDFAVMLAAFRDAGYSVEWRVINAADYGFAQRRRRVFIFAYRNDTAFGKKQAELIKTVGAENLIHQSGFFASEFPLSGTSEKHAKVDREFTDIIFDVSDNFTTLFRNSGVMINEHIYSEETIPAHFEPTPLRDILEEEVDEKYFLQTDKKMKSGKTIYEQFEYLKGPKKVPRKSVTGHEYMYSEGGMAFPDPLDKPGRTMLTSEGTVNRSTHVVEDLKTGRLRLLTPVECERLNGFEDNWTSILPDRVRYFTMGNALVVGLIEKMGKKIKAIYEEEKVAVSRN
jgi:DNA (cytosine-5)-methyltransferase 1